MIESDGVSISVHYRRLRADRPVPSLLSSSAKHEYKKDIDPATHEVHENDCVVGID